MAKKAFASSDLQKLTKVTEEADPIAITLVELTDKKYKAIILAGAMMFRLGILLGLYNLYEFIDLEQGYGKNIVEIGTTFTFQALIDEEPALQVALWGIVLGFILKRFGKFLAWWYHG
jgi:hypothetical protein